MSQWHVREVQEIKLRMSRYDSDFLSVSNNTSKAEIVQLSFREFLTKKEEYEDGNENIEVVDELVLQTLEEPGLEELVPGPGWHERDEQKKDHHDLCVEEPGDQGPVQTHH